VAILLSALLSLVLGMQALSDYLLQSTKGAGLTTL